MIKAPLVFKDYAGDQTEREPAQLVLLRDENSRRSCPVDMARAEQAKQELLLSIQRGDSLCVSLMKAAEGLAAATGDGEFYKSVERVLMSDDKEQLQQELSRTGDRIEALSTVDVDKLDQDTINGIAAALDICIERYHSLQEKLEKR